MHISIANMADHYKLSHSHMEPRGLTKVYNNTVARTSRIDGVDYVVMFGTRLLINRIQEFFDNFFYTESTEEFEALVEKTCGLTDTLREKIRALHHLQYAPLLIKALPEGTKVPLQTPLITITNTHKDHAWLCGFIETVIQQEFWKPLTSATIAHHFRQMLLGHAERTCDNADHVMFQGHDFSARGMSQAEACISSGMGHLTSFMGTDSFAAVAAAKDIYGDECVGYSVPATEHSVSQMNILQDVSAGFSFEEAEQRWIYRLITELFPTGIVSVVADTYDYWKTISVVYKNLRDVIMQRDGKLVCRPDSGDPYHIVCGYKVSEVNMLASEVRDRIQRMNDLFNDCEAVHTTDGLFLDSSGKELSLEEVKGSIVILDEIFGSTTNSKGYQELDPHIGLIYGDAIFYDRADRILTRLAEMGYASNNIVLGIGSYTYQYNTRDTFGVACKATYCEIDGEGLNLYKDPKTDRKKKSLRGLLRVNADKTTSQEVSWEEESGGLLTTIFHEGSVMSQESFAQVRERLLNES